MLDQKTLACGSNMGVIDRIRETSGIKLPPNMQATARNHILCLQAKDTGKQWVQRHSSYVQVVPVQRHLPAGALMQVQDGKVDNEWMASPCLHWNAMITQLAFIIVQMRKETAQQKEVYRSQRGHSMGASLAIQV